MLLCELLKQAAARSAGRCGAWMPWRLKPAIAMGWLASPGIFWDGMGWASTCAPLGAVVLARRAARGVSAAERKL